MKALHPSPFKLGCLILFAACLLFHSFGRDKPPFLAAIDNRLGDAMFRWRGPTATTGQVIIVDIDEKSLSRLGQWPWPRNLIAGLVRRLDGAGARVIGFDVVFPEVDRTSPLRSLQSLRELVGDEPIVDLLARLGPKPDLDHDLALGDAVATAPVVLGYVFQQRDDGLKSAARMPFPSAILHLDPPSLGYAELNLPESYRAVLNIPEISQAETEGFFNVFPDPSGTVRKAPLFMAMDGIPYPCLALEMARIGLGVQDLTLHASTRTADAKRDLLGVSLGDRRFLPTDGRGQATINYRGGFGTFAYLSAADVLAETPSERLRDRFVLIGSSAAGLLDLRATPFSNIYPGVEIQATLIDNVLAGDLFRHDQLTEIGITYTLIVVGGLLTTALLAFAGPVAGGAGAIAVLALALVGNYHFFFLRNQMVGITYPLAVMVVLFMAVTLFNYFWEGRQRRFIRGAFTQYVAPQVVSRLEKNPEQLSLAGEQKDLTVLFSDIRGFTSLSEKMEPERLAAFMNEFLTLESDLVMAHDGMVDKYIGDAVLAIWGAPLDDPHHPQKAVRAALQIVDRLAEVRPQWRQRGLPTIDIGIGINTGLMSVGNFGSRQRLEYTVIGDAVNLASRLEGSNKLYGTAVLISEFTRAELGDDFFCRYVDLVRVKGRSQPVRLFEPLLEGKPGDELRRKVETFESALAAYRNRQFEQARRKIRQLHLDSPRRLYEVYLERIESFQKNPPPEDWQGVFTFVHK